MKKLLLSAAFASTCAHAELPDKPINFERLAACIAQVETRNDCTKIGKAGERSAYQITEVVWRKQTDSWFGFASGNSQYEKNIARLVCIAHLTECYRLIDNPSVFRIALAYAAGVSVANHAAKVTKAKAGYGQRVENLYNDIEFTP